MLLINNLKIKIIKNYYNFLNINLIIKKKIKAKTMNENSMMGGDASFFAESAFNKGENKIMLKDYTKNSSNPEQDFDK